MAIPLSPGTSEWSLLLPEDFAEEKGQFVIVETVGVPHIANSPRVIRQATDGRITLPAHEAVTHGKSLRYEPQPHKNTLGYWSQEDDWCEWLFAVARPGEFEVHILQGCGKGHGGSEVAIHVGDTTLKFLVEDTGHFQNFKDRVVGTVSLRQGRASLQLRPMSKAAGAVMDVRQVELVPIRGGAAPKTPARSTP